MRLPGLIPIALITAGFAAPTEPIAGQQRGQPPRPAAAQPAAPSVFTAKFETSKGPFTVRFERDSAPNGVDRAYQLIREGFFNDSRFYRVIPGFVAQFGIAADFTLGPRWERDAIPDDSVRGSNVRGTVTFAAGGPNSRTTQIFVNIRDNARLDAMGFAPIGTVIDGMEVVDSLYSGYGEISAGFGQVGWGDSVGTHRNRYFDRAFPLLDHIVRVEIVSPPSPAGTVQRD